MFFDLLRATSDNKKQQNY